jgi:hypothetical protein
MVMFTAYEHFRNAAKSYVWDKDGGSKKQQ